MKLLIVLAILPILAYTLPATDTARAQAKSIDPVESSLDDIELLEEDEASRTKRSGLDVGQLKQSLVSKIGGASSSLISGASSSSFGGSSGNSGHGGGSYEHSGYGGEGTGHSAGGFDAFKLKRDIVNTLLQAVKAITGSIVGLKGQLIKGSGYLVSSGGKLIAASGDQVTKGSSGIAGSIASLSGSSSSSSSGKGGSDHSSSGHGGYTAYESHGSYGVPETSYDSGDHFGSVSHSYTPHGAYGPPSHSVTGAHYFHNHRDPPVYLTTGHSTLDLYAPAASQKTHSVQQAANVLRNLINKLPDKDLELQLSNYASNQKAIPFSVHDHPPFKNLPNSINSLSDPESPQVPPPLGADPEAYKVYRAMAAKLASNDKHPTPEKKPYIILDSKEFYDSPHSHVQTLIPKNNLEIQKTIQFAFHEPPQIVIHRREGNVATYPKEAH